MSLLDHSDDAWFDFVTLPALYFLDSVILPDLTMIRENFEKVGRLVKGLLNQYSPVPRARSSTAGKDATRQR